MNTTALVFADFTVSYTAVFAALGALAALLMTLSLCFFRGHDARAALLLFPLALLFSPVLGRLMHWYSHPLQYAGFLAALTNFQSGGFSLSGAFWAVLLAAALVYAVGLTDDLPRLLDALAPGAALGLAIGRLGALFGIADRGHFALTAQRFHGLPFSVPVDGVWRFATFFWQSLHAGALFPVLLLFYLRGNRRCPPPDVRRNGHVAALFLALYSVGQLVLDSTRYDADFLRANGFIHVTQVLCLAALCGLTVYYGLLCLRRREHTRRCLLLFACALAGILLGAFMEYFVQRQGERFLLAYGLMLLGFALAGAVFIHFFRAARRGGAAEPLSKEGSALDKKTASHRLRAAVLVLLRFRQRLWGGLDYRARDLHTDAHGDAAAHGDADPRGGA